MDAELYFDGLPGKSMKFDRNGRCRWHGKVLMRWSRSQSI
jgi:hypothetical protein